MYETTINDFRFGIYLWAYLCGCHNSNNKYLCKIDMIEITSQFVILFVNQQTKKYNAVLDHMFFNVQLAKIPKFKCYKQNNSSINTN